MFDLPALDVAVGLLFLYLVLALVCSTANEAISTALGMRARFLQLGLLNLLSASPNVTAEGQLALKKLYAHPLVQTLVRPGRGPDPAGDPVTTPPAEDADPTQPTKWWRKPPYPSYLPSRAFVAALTDMARDTTEWQSEARTEEAEKAVARMEVAAGELERAIASIPNTRLSEALMAVYRTAGGEASAFERAAERWFDDSMERVSGWYKRRVQLFLLVIASVVVVLLNADTITAGRVLWRDDAVRAATVKQAETAAASDDGDVEQAVQQLDLPLGWSLTTGDGPTEIPNDPLAILAKIFGLALTVGAVMLGAPFWFDLLSKIMRVRSTGAPPPASDAVRKGEGEQARAGPGAAPPAS